MLVKQLKMQTIFYHCFGQIGLMVFNLSKKEIKKLKVKSIRIFSSTYKEAEKVGYDYDCFILLNAKGKMIKRLFAKGL